MATTITQDMRYRLSLIKYADKFAVTKAAIKYKTNRQYIYRWKRRYDGSLESLRNRSRRPHHHFNQHTPDEIKLITDSLAGIKSFEVRNDTKTWHLSLKVPVPYFRIDSDARVHIRQCRKTNRKKTGKHLTEKGAILYDR